MGRLMIQKNEIDLVYHKKRLNAYADNLTR